MNKELARIEKESNSYIKKANEYDIVCQEVYESAGKFLLKVKTLIKEIKITFEPIVKKAHEVHKEATKQKNRHLEPVAEAEKILKDKCKAYENEMHRKELERQAEAEKEKQRLIAEENKKRQDEAELLGDDPEKVEEATVEDIEVEQPLPSITKIKGLGVRRVWRAKVIDKSKIPLEYMIPDMGKLNGMARALKADFNIKGVEAVEE